MGKQRSTKSYIAEYGIKILMIFYITSVIFYPETLDPANNFDAKLSISFIIRLIVLVVFAVFLLAINDRLFKYIGFSSIALGAFVKLLLLMSQPNFSLHQILVLSDSLIIMGISFYYLYRHQLKIEAYHKKKTQKKHQKKLSDI